MIHAIILAGGKGVRTGLSVPKQFHVVNHKPIIIYTLETFQEHPRIDNIICVCIDGFSETLRDFAKKYKITKLSHITSGGPNSQSSIFQGLLALENLNISPDDAVVIHDGVRPMVDESVLSDVIIKSEAYDGVATALPYNEQIFYTDNGISSDKYIPRETLRRVQTPQAYKFGKLLTEYKTAFEQGIETGNSSYANTLWVQLGNRLYFAAGSEKNIKITCSEDIDLFKVYLK
jgi:2-C-methyl-D-erythritol 4-phosphate cytidylyltransferase